MLDTTTQKRLTVARSASAGPLIFVRLDQLDDVRSALDAHGLTYWVDKYAIKLGTNPPLTAVNFGRKGDADRVQAALDAVN